MNTLRYLVWNDENFVKKKKLSAVVVKAAVSRTSLNCSYLRYHHVNNYRRQIHQLPNKVAAVKTE